MTTNSELLLRPATAEEFPALWDRLFDTFAETAHDEDRVIEAAVFEPARSLIALDGDELVATAGIETRELTVPGGIVGMAGVTLVTVAPTHRRRGLLTAIIRRQLTELHEHGGEPIAGLWASESAIYQRFGYGSATQRGMLSGPTRELRFRTGTDLGSGRIRRISAEEVGPHAVRIFGQLRPLTPGFLSRSAAVWKRRHFDPEYRREGATATQFVVYREPDGEVSGFAEYRLKSDFDTSGPNGTVTVYDVATTAPPAYAALWRYLLDLDLMRTMQRRMGSVDEPLRHLLVDPRALTIAVTDALWLRLVDVDRALAARTYSNDIDLVLEVADDFCPWNAGRWRLTGGPDGATCRPSTATADLALTSTELGAAFLGGTSLTALARAGRVREITPGALHHAAIAFSSPVTPWCPEVF